MSAPGCLRPALVGLTASLLLWPCGTAASVQRTINAALQVSARYLTAAVARITTTTATMCRSTPDVLVDKLTGNERQVFGLLGHPPAPNPRPIGNPPD